ncbi:MAG: CDF family Co(II)/Ni(II) efflux transporter DmeF [Steroidobacteraceae bacterium]
MSAPGTQDSHCHTPLMHGGNPTAERRTKLVVLLTAVMMVIELSAGWLFHSMALLADGWHMSSHVIALGLSAAAYALARRWANDQRFAFGTWKIEILGGYTSALLLFGIAGYMVYESVSRLRSPVVIAYNEALAIAVLGLLVNLASAWLLGGAEHGHHHGHGHDLADHDHHDEQGHEHGQDLNLRSAYIHVAADAATSVLAIAALLGGKYFGAAWLDPVMGLVGTVVVAVWAIGLLRDTGRILVDAEMDSPVVAEIREVIAASPIPATLQDLHVWRVAHGKYACILSVSAPPPATPELFRSLLSIHEELVHITVEVNHSAA